MPKLASFKPEIHKKQNIEGYETIVFLSFLYELAFITWERSERPGTQYSIWVMKEYGVVESWNKLRVVPFERVSHCSAFTENGSLSSLLHQ